MQDEKNETKQDFKALMKECSSQRFMTNDGTSLLRHYKMANDCQKGYAHLYKKIIRKHQETIVQLLFL